MKQNKQPHYEKGKQFSTSFFETLQQKNSNNQTQINIKDNAYDIS